MKNVKRLFSLMLAIMMIAMAVVPVGAVPMVRSSSETGTIRLYGAQVGHTYYVYRILDLYSYVDFGDSTSYIYTLRPTNTDNADDNARATAWNKFVATAADEDNNKYFLETIKSVFNADKTGYVNIPVISWNALAGETDVQQEARTAALSQLAHEKARTPGALIKSDADATITNEGQLKTDLDGKTYLEFSNLPLGYYLVSSTVGALCALTTVDTVANITNKNESPDQVKKVLEDSTNIWGDTNDTDVDTLVEFCATIIKRKGATNYILHDQMESGLVFTGANDVVVQYTDSDAPLVDNQLITVSPGDFTYRVVANPGTCTVSGSDKSLGNCAFHVEFYDELLNAIDDGEEIRVYYKAKLDIINAEIGRDRAGNLNQTALEYGDKHYTAWDSTLTYTWEFGIRKYRSDGETQASLEGAGFTIYTKYEDGQLSEPLYFHSEKNKRPYYRPCFNVHAPDENAPVQSEMLTEIYTGSDTEVKDSGYLFFQGLDSGTYYIRETTVPAGYTPAPDYKVVISNTGAVTFYKLGSETPEQTTSNIIHIENKSTPILPETGGIGTTIFYVAGSIMVVGAVLFLVTKRRMRFDAE